MTDSHAAVTAAYDLVQALLAQREHGPVLLSPRAATAVTSLAAALGVDVPPDDPHAALTRQFRQVPALRHPSGYVAQYMPDVVKHADGVEPRPWILTHHGDDGDLRLSTYTNADAADWTSLP